MTSIYFRNIRSDNISKNVGFEELCCQLASLEIPEAGAQWIRKEGAGGDAGVEAYWRLQNGNEHCWQVKYVFSLRGAQWKQIEKSVKTALAKHPDMVRYVICLPINLTDARQKEWNKKVCEWNNLYPERKIEFELWNAHKITNRLIQNGEQNAGLIKYWFDKNYLTEGWFKKRIQGATAALGPRYTPELNVELDISKAFHGLAHTSLFKKAVIQRWKTTHFYTANNKIKEILGEVKNIKKSVSKVLNQHNPYINFSAQANQLKKIGNKIETTEEKFTDEDDFRNIRSILHDVKEHWYYLTGDEDILAAQDKVLLITGNAGTGKSHLFADIANQFIQDGLPVVLLLGQQFNDNDPWGQILRKLDIQGSAEEFLGALDTAAQAKKVRALIMIDALNEGAGQKLWKKHLASFIKKIEPYPYVALAISCRTPYEKRVIPESVRKKHLCIEHQGFAGHEDEAAQIYLDKQGIARPSAPHFSPELSNPLFLKTICDSLKREGETAIPKGLRGIESIFDFYTRSLKQSIEDKLELDVHQNIVGKAIASLIEEMNQNQTLYIEKTRAVEIFEKIHSSRGLQSGSLLDALLGESFLFENIFYEGKQEQDIILFTFERFFDHFRAKHLLGQYQDSDQLAKACASPNGKIYELLNKYSYGYSGLIEALSIQVPEKYGRELLDFFPNNPLEDSFSFINDIENQFENSLLWRAPSAVNDNTLHWINRIFPDGVGNIDFIDTLVRAATEPQHKLNAFMLHKNIMPLSLATRDASWSISITKLYHTDSDYYSPIQTLIDWAWHGNKQNMEPERIELASITIAWFLSSPNRALRDRATKALVSLLRDNVYLTRKLLLRFDKINDPYILERIYAAAYGVAMHLNDAEGCARLAQTVYNRIFRNNKPPPHILLRDYARGIIEKATHMGKLPSHICCEKARPPYESDWPLIDPGVEAIEAMDDMGMVKHSVMTGDFGTYTMRKIFTFGATPRSEGRPKSWTDLTNKFLNRLKNPNAVGVANKVIDAEENVNENRMSPNREQLEATYNAEYEFLKSKLSPTEKETLRWLRLAKSNDLAIFSRRLAKRWVVNRVREMGWTKERFAEFERDYADSYNRIPATAERMGKKYQWIAYHELLARMADNLYYIGYDKNPITFTNPWEEFLRDIDPSYLIDAAKKQKITNNWWRPNIVKIPADMSNEQIKQWISKTENLPDTKNLIQRIDEKNQEWFVLDSLLQQKKDHEKYSYLEDAPWGQMSILTQAFFAKKQDIKRIINYFKLHYHDTPIGRVEIYDSGGGNDCQGFLSEYDWHPAWLKASEQVKLHFSFDGSITFTGHKPIYEYALEKDNSINERIDIKLPSPLVRSLLNLDTHNIINAIQFSESDIPFLYKSRNGEYSTMARRQDLIQPLSAIGLDIIWISSIEKLSVGSMKPIGKRLIHSAVVTYDGNNFTAHQWTLLQQGGAHETIQPFKKTNFP